MDLKNVFDKSWKPALSVTLAVTVTTMWDMAAVPPMGQRVAVPPMGDRVAVPPMGDRVAVPPMGDRVALSPNLVVNEILRPGLCTVSLVLSAVARGRVDIVSCRRDTQ